MSNCLNCGTELPVDAPAGQCPKCLLPAGLVSENQPRSVETLSSPVMSRFQAPSIQDLANRFPQLEILELLGKGGMGAVYKARQSGLERLVAVKILPPEIGNDSAFAERFAREARALARLNHTNIVTFYDFGQVSPMANSSTSKTQNDETLFYIVMEYVDGVNLRQMIQTGGLKPSDALAIVPQICEALQFSHDEGIVHRDITPENILIDKKGRVKIADFGLAKLLGSALTEQMLTGTGQVMGTLRYMAPEQTGGSSSVDHRADIYSLGVVFYEMLTGELPMGRFAPPSEKARLDARLDEVVLRSLAKEPERRYQQVSQIKLDVDNISSSIESPISTETKTPDATIEFFKTRLFPLYSIVVFTIVVLAWCIGFVIPVLGVAGIVLPFHRVLGLGSLRSVSVDQCGISIQQLFGPSKVLSWKDVVRVTPVSRLQVACQLIFRHGQHSNGPAVGLPMKHYFKVQGREDCWFFCPKDPFAFVEAIRSHNCTVDAKVRPESPPIKNDFSKEKPRQTARFSGRSIFNSGLRFMLWQFLLIGGLLFIVPKFKELHVTLTGQDDVRTKTQRFHAAGKISHSHEYALCRSLSTDFLFVEFLWRLEKMFVTRDSKTCKNGHEKIQKLYPIRSSNYCGFKERFEINTRSLPCLYPSK